MGSTTRKFSLLHRKYGCKSSGERKLLVAAARQTHSKKKKNRKTKTRLIQELNRGFTITIVKESLDQAIAGQNQGAFLLRSVHFFNFIFGFSLN